MTTTARLLSHLEWLRDHLDQTPAAEEAVYSVALRLRAETLKDRTSDAILPKTIRRQLREKVDALIDTSREASVLAEADQQAQASSFVVIRKKITPVTRLGVRAELFDGQAVEWQAASKPMLFSELMAFVSLPDKDKEASQIKSPVYQRRLLAAFKTILSASLLQAKARTKTEKKRAAEALDVGAAMLSEASRGLPLTPEVRAARKHDKAIAAAFAKDHQQGSRRSSK